MNQANEPCVFEVQPVGLTEAENRVLATLVNACQRSRGNLLPGVMDNNDWQVLVRALTEIDSVIIHTGGNAP